MSKGIETELRATLAERAQDVPPEAVERLRRIDYRPRSQALSPRLAIAGAAGLAATSGAVVAIVGLGAGTSPAFAGWTATPTRPANGQTARAQEHCFSQLAVAGGAPSKIPATGWQPVLTDTRGPFTLMILRSGSSSATCFNGPSFTTVAANSAQGSAGGSEHVPTEHVLSRRAGTGGPQSEPVPREHVLSSRAGSGGPQSVMRYSTGGIGPATESHLVARGGQPYTFVQGQVVPGVSGVTLLRSDGGNVQATVADGSFATWWPGSSDATSAQVTSASGVTTQQLTFAAVSTGNAAHDGSSSTLPSP
jgi:hypothetical protein